MQVENASETLRRSAERPVRRIMVMVLVSLLAAWFLWPIFTSVHLEGFSASLHVMAILLHRHGRAGLSLADQGFPLTTEYLYLTRSGLVDALNWTITVTGLKGDGAFRLVILASMVAYVWSSLIVARRWSGDKLLLLFAVLVLTPGMVDIAFSFADNLPSAALAMMALACVKREETSAPRWFAVGALFAMAILVRVDAVLIAPAVGLCLLLGKPRLRLLSVRVVSFVAGGLVVVGLAQWLTPYRLLDSARITAQFARLQAGWAAPWTTLVPGFFGLITAVLVLLGIARNVRTHGWRWNLGLVILPALFYAYALCHGTEIRDFMLLGTPAVLIHGAAGVRMLQEQWATRLVWRRAAVVAVLLAFTAVMFAPVSIKMQDGPRTSRGLFWTPLVWHEWQQSVADGMHDLDGVIASIQPGETMLVISSNFNADRYFRLQLLEDGYDIVPFAQAPATCNGIAEVLRKGDRTVFHLRSENPYRVLLQSWHMPLDYAIAFQLKEGLDCMAGYPVQKTVLLNWGEAASFFRPVVQGTLGTGPIEWQTTFPTDPHIPSRKHDHYGRVNVQPLSSSAVETLRRSATMEVSRQEQAATEWKPLANYADLHSKFLWHFWQPPQ
jgi:hypothetical protein